jgi:hypothetical protein
VSLDIKRVVGYRQFCNKIWNAFKFGMTYLADFVPYHSMHTHIIYNTNVAPREQWILSRLNQCIIDTNTAITDYLFGNATSSLYSFFLYDVCDVYLEICKPVFQAVGTEAEDAEQVRPYPIYHTPYPHTCSSLILLYHLPTLYPIPYTLYLIPHPFSLYPLYHIPPIPPYPLYHLPIPYRCV